jgi:hypothetical protein
MPFNPEHRGLGSGNVIGAFRQGGNIDIAQPPECFNVRRADESSAYDTDFDLLHVFHPLHKLSVSPSHRLTVTPSHCPFAL